LAKTAIYVVFVKLIHLNWSKKNQI